MNGRTNRELAVSIGLPLIGFGTYLISDIEARSVVSTAIDAGYRHIDTAEIYGNEAGVGAAIDEVRRTDRLSRDELFVTTKLWPGNPAWGQLRRTYQTTLEALDGSLARLQLDFVDLYLIHAPFDKDSRLEQWRALVELRQVGKARAIGVSNFNQAHIAELEHAGFPLPEADQIELHPWSQKPSLISYLAEKGIAAIAYSSLVPLSTWRAAEGQKSAKTDDMRADGERGDSPFRAMARKYGVSQAQVLLRWAVQKGYPVLPKSVSPERIRQNMDLFSFSLDDEDMSAIETMDRGKGVAWGAGDPTELA